MVALCAELLARTSCDKYRAVCSGMIWLNFPSCGMKWPRNFRIGCRIMAYDTFRAGNLTAIIGDNEGYGKHQAGLNGIHQLTHRDEPTTIFLPTAGGLNLEHIFDGDKDL